MVQLLDKEVGPIGYGLMGLSWRPEPQALEKSLATMKAAYESGAYFWNGGEFYGTPEYNSAHILKAYFEKYPEDAEKIVLSVKGGMNMEKMKPDGSEPGIKKSMDTFLKTMGQGKSLDLFEPARVDPEVKIEDTVSYIEDYVKEGKVKGISLSEVNANTINRVAKVAKVSAVEVEFSLFSPDILTNGIAKACAEHGIPIVAYSPIGRGFLTGEIKKPEDIPEGDFRRHMPRFQDDAFYQNMKLVDEVKGIAERKGATPAQIAIGWVAAHSGRDGLGPIIPIPGATTESRVKENTKLVKLTEDEFQELNEIIKKIPIVGDRYGGPQKKLIDQ